MENYEVHEAERKAVRHETEQKSMLSRIIGILVIVALAVVLLALSSLIAFIIYG